MPLFAGSPTFSGNPGIPLAPYALSILAEREARPLLTLSDMMWNTDTSWREDAACSGVDSDLFFPVTDDEEATAQAKAICETCPVKDACLSYSLATNQAAGVWGGLDANERRRLRRRLRDRERRKAS